MYKKSSVYPERYYHISRKDLGRECTLIPSEGYSPSGVSFAPTIAKCLSAVPYYFTGQRADWERRKRFVKQGNIWYVYTPVKKTEAISISSKMTPDVLYSKERRVLGNVKVKRIGKIRVSVGYNRWKIDWL